MRSVVMSGPGRVELADVPDARLEEPGDAVVRITRSAICGSDLHALHGRMPMEPGEPIGHEGVGVVEAVGADVEGFQAGDRVAMPFATVCGTCWYCQRGESALCSSRRNLGLGAAAGGLGGLQAEAVRIPLADHNLLAIPEDVD